MAIKAIMSIHSTLFYRTPASRPFATLLVLASLLMALSTTVHAATVQIGVGTIDSTKVNGPRWTRVDFNPLTTGSHTIAVAWDSNADIRFNVFRADGTRLSSSTVQGSNPGLWSGDLIESEQYYIGLWARTGQANYTATLEAETTDPVNDPVDPEITTHPADVTVTEGDDAVFSVVATGSGILTYQWFANGTAITGATTGTLTISATTLNDTGTIYSVEVSDDNGSGSSTGATLTVEAAPITLAITTNPADVTVTEGEAATFSVVATGSGTLTYQWFADGTALTGATESSLLISPTSLADSGNVYLVQVNDDSDATAFASATLTVEPFPLLITSQPADLTVTEGEDASFTVIASGSGTLTYQWLADGVPVVGATQNTLTISPATLTDNGSGYSVEVTDISGSIISASAILSVDEIPVTVVITSQPSSLVVDEGESATFTVIAGGSGTLGYQWSDEGGPITGAIGSTLTISSATLADDGNAYSVEVTDDNGSVISDNAILGVQEVVVHPVTVVEIGQGTLDADKVVGPRWIQHNFDSLAAAVHTLTVSWDSDADVRYNVFQADGAQLSSTIRGANPGVWSGALNANEQYYIALWSSSGIANYTATIEASVPLSIVKQPADLIVTEGADADFAVQATGSGTLTYQWFADGVALSGETSEALTVFSTTVADNDGVSYTVEVDNGITSVTSDAASLTVNAPVIPGLFSQEADTTTWALEGPASTLDYNATSNSDGWGRVLLRVGDALLVGGDFQGIKPSRSSHGNQVIVSPYLAAFDAVSGQPLSAFQFPSEVDSVVRALVLSPDGTQVYVGGDFGLLLIDAATGALDQVISVKDGNNTGRVFDIAVTNTQLYIGGDFTKVNNVSRVNIARLSLDGVLDASWTPNVTNGFTAGRSAPVQSLAIAPSGNIVYVGGNFQKINNTDVATTPPGGRVSLLPISAIDGTVQPERFIADVGNNSKGLTAHDIAATEFYVIVAWGGPNKVTFHDPDGTRLRQYEGKGDVQSIQVVGNHAFIGHHGEFFGSKNNPNPPEAVVSLNPDVLEPFKIHSFRIDDPQFPAEQSWQIGGSFGIWGIAAAEDSLWVAGNIFRAGSNDQWVEGLARFPALD